MVGQRFFANWARFRLYPTKIPPFEPQFHAEFENEGPRASFFDFDAVFDYFYISQGTPLRRPDWPLADYILFDWRMGDCDCKKNKNSPGLWPSVSDPAIGWL